MRSFAAALVLVTACGEPPPPRPSWVVRTPGSRAARYVATVPDHVRVSLSGDDFAEAGACEPLCGAITRRPGERLAGCILLPGPRELDRDIVARTEDPRCCDRMVLCKFE